MLKVINKKSESLPINIIIVAVLALVVLVILIAIFTGRVRIFSDTLQSCTAKQGQCKPQCEYDEVVITNTNCQKTEECCLKVLSS